MGSYYFGLLCPILSLLHFGHLHLSFLIPISTGPLWKAYRLYLAQQNYTVPSGDLLMLSPFWLHRNPKYFPEPDLFKPERWKEANLEKHAFLDCFMAFGSGKYQCPGRWLALLEIQICIILIFYYYDCSLLDPLPKQSSLHLVGVQQPEGRCRIQFKQRKWCLLEGQGHLEEWLPPHPVAWWHLDLNLTRTRHLILF